MDNGVILLTVHGEDGNPCGKLDPRSGNLYNLEGEFEYKLQTEGADRYMSDSHILSAGHLRNAEHLDQVMSLRAASYDVERRGEAIRKKLQLRDTGRSGGVKVLMDLGITDVHISSAMPNFAGGYMLEDGVADIALPIVPTSKQSDQFFIWNSGNAFTPAAVNMGAPGGSPFEISPSLSKNPYTAIEYGLASYVPTEVEANADAPLRPYEAAVDLVMNKLRMAREMRAASLLTTSANFNSNNVLALAGGANWDGGASSDPIANIQYIMQRSYKPVTRIIMGERIFQAMQRNAAVRQYHAYKSGAQAMPNSEQLSSIMQLPPIVVATMKYTSAAGAPTYVWPCAAGSASSVVLLHEPAQNPPSDGRNNATGYTFRWTGASAPDGTVTGGFLVRSYYDPRRGGRGGRIVVVLHNDAEVVTGNILGGLITNIMST